MFQRAVAILGAALLVFSAGVKGHSWIDELEVVGGVATGNKGYIRNYPGHENSAQWLIQIGGAEFNTSVCGTTNGQNIPGNYPNPQYPPLKAAPGDTVKGSYTENGHVSKLFNEESKPGTTWWYGTTDPTEFQLWEVIEWTTDGQGGNKKGFLMSTADYDDGWCVEDRGADQNDLFAPRGSPKGGRPCVSTFRIPQSMKPGETLYVFWVWDFSWNLGVHRMEWYTSCADIQIADPDTIGTADESSGNQSHRRALKYRSAKFAAALW